MTTDFNNRPTMLNATSPGQLLPHLDARNAASVAAGPTQAPPPPIPWPMPPNWAELGAMLSDKDFRDANEEIAKGVAEFIEEAYQSRIEGLHLVSPEWPQRLRLYRAKPFALWQEQYAKDPRQYEKDQADMRHLEARAARLN